MNQWWQEERTRDDPRPASLLVVDVTPPGLGAQDEISANEDRPRRVRRLWRRIAEPVLLLAAVATVFGFTKLADERDRSASPATPLLAASPSSHPAAGAPPTTDATSRRLAPPASPQFLVPATARPGEQITIVAYRDDRLCGPTVLRFDGAQIAHEVPGTTQQATADWVEVFLKVQIPSAVSLGHHRIELFGPVAGGQSGVLCGAEPEHQDRLADAEVIVIP